MTRTYRRLATIAVLGFFLAGCNNSDEMPVAGENYQNLDGTPVAAGERLEQPKDSTTLEDDLNLAEGHAGPYDNSHSGSIRESGGAVTIYPPQSSSLPATLLRSIPEDSAKFYEDMMIIHSPAGHSEATPFLEPAVHFSGDNYPIFTATCFFNPENSECALGDGTLVDEAYLVNKLPLVRNWDALREDWSCGQVCVDEDGRVMGRVSPEMIAWRDRNCSWAVYGSARCN